MLKPPLLKYSLVLIVFVCAIAGWLPNQAAAFDVKQLAGRWIETGDKSIWNLSINDRGEVLIVMVQEYDDTSGQWSDVFDADGYATIWSERQFQGRSIFPNNVIVHGELSADGTQISITETFSTCMKYAKGNCVSYQPKTVVRILKRK